MVTIHPWVDGNGRTTRLLMNMVQRQLVLIPSMVTKEAKVEYIQTLIDSREREDYTYNEYAQALRLSRATIARYLKGLNGKVIRRIGSDKDGYWEFVGE